MEKVDTLEKCSGALWRSEPSWPPQHGARLYLVSTWHSGASFPCSGSAQGALQTGNMCVFGSPRVISLGFSEFVGRWLRVATRVGLDSSDMRDNPAIPESLADRLAPRGPLREPQNAAKVSGLEIAL